VVCQSEFDSIRIKILSVLLRFPYRVFVFGQMFQFESDISKYSTVFRRFIPEVLEACPGYRETVHIPHPKLSPPVWLANELISRLKRWGVRGAAKVFTLSNQVKWEVEILYQRDASVLRAAFHEKDIDVSAVSSPRPVGRPPRFLSVCRLVPKKRVDIAIRALGLMREPGLLTVIGSGPELENLRTLAAASPVASSIRVLGSVSDETLKAELSAADGFISMDIGDFDISVVEAMAHGLRVLVAEDFDLSSFGSDFSGARRVVVSPEALADAMADLEEMPAPGPGNLRALGELTWQHMGREIVAP
jgi:glycosyltransferase involved in cell wall biosynthesis